MPPPPGPAGVLSLALWQLVGMFFRFILLYLFYCCVVLDVVFPWQDLFDIVLAGPLAGLAASTAALLLGLQMTAAAGTEALAGR